MRVRGLLEKGDKVGYDHSVRNKAVLIEGFHVTSCQANFASYHTRNCHVGFLFPQ